MLDRIYIALFIVLCCSVVSQSKKPIYNIACMPELTNSTYRNQVEGDCIALRSDSTLNVTLFYSDIRGNITDSILQACLSGPDMIILNNVQVVDAVVTLGPRFPNILFVLSRVPTVHNVQMPANSIWLEYYEQILWFMKGVLAAKFSTKQEFVIQIPVSTGSPALFITSTNFYYAGLLYVKPTAVLKAIFHNTFGRDALQIVQFAMNISTHFDVFANFASQTFFPGNLSACGKYEIGNQMSVHSPASDVSALTTSTTLTISVYDLVPFWQNIIKQARDNSEDLERANFIRSRQKNVQLQYLSSFSHVVPEHVKEDVSDLLEQFYFHLDQDHPQILCQDFITNVMSKVMPLPNGCVDVLQMVEGIILHPDILQYNF